MARLIDEAVSRMRQVRSGLAITDFDEPVLIVEVRVCQHGSGMHVKRTTPIADQGAGRDSKDPTSTNTTE